MQGKGGKMDFFDLLWCGEYAYAWKDELRDSNAFFLIAVSRGRLFVSVDRCRHELKAGDMFLIFPGEDYAVYSEGEEKEALHTYNASFEVHDSRLLSRMMEVRQIRTVENFYLVRSCFNRILQECEKKEDFYAMTSSCYFWMVLLELMSYDNMLDNRSGGAESVTKGKHIRREGDIIPFPKDAGDLWRAEKSTGRNADMYIVERYCRENYMRQIFLEEIVELVHYNKTSLLQRFKEVYGTTPRNYIIQIRLQKAKELLADTDYSISEISDQVGFASVHYFSRFFKEKENYSPLEYRVEHTKNRSYVLRRV